MPKTRNRKHRKKFKKKAGTLQNFRGTKVALANLEQHGIT